VNRRYKRGKDGPDKRRFSILMFLSGSYLIGIGLGCLFASYLKIDLKNPLMTYLNEYLTLVEEKNVAFPAFLSVYWEIIRWPIGAALFGITLLSVGVIPCIFAARGFLMSYTVSMFLRLYSIRGLVPAAAFLGISSLISVISLFEIGIESFSYGLNLCNSKSELNERSRAQKKVLTHFLITILWAGAGAILCSWITPHLLCFTAEFIP